MHCPYCGTSMPDSTKTCSKCGAGATLKVGQMFTIPAGRTGTNGYYDHVENYSEQDECPQTDDFPITVPRRACHSSGGRKRRNKPHIALRLPLQLLSLVLSIVLTVCLLATALLMDLNRMLSAGGIKQVVNALFTVSQAKVPGPLAGAVGMNAKLDNTDMTLPGDVDISDLEIPADVLTSGDSEALVDWMVEVLEQTTGTELDVDKAQLQQFVDKSTISDYMAEKAAGYAQDFINGTRNTQITSEELMTLIEENEDLIASTFQVELTGEMKAELKTALTQTIEGNRLNEVIHEEMFAAMQDAISDALPVDWEQIQTILKILTSDAVLMAAVGVCVVLMLLLCVLNFYDIPGGLTWSAVACIVSGALLSAPVILLQASPQLLTDMAYIPVVVAQLIMSFIGVLSLVHYGILALGVVLLLLSIVWRVIRAGAQNSAPTAF